MKARRLFCQLAVRAMGYSGAEVGRYLRVTTSAVNRLSVSEGLPDFVQFNRDSVFFIRKPWSTS
jgi:hypothetical protein